MSQELHHCSHNSIHGSQHLVILRILIVTISLQIHTHEREGGIQTSHHLYATAQVDRIHLHFATTQWSSGISGLV